MEEVTNQGESSHSGGEQGSPNPEASQEKDVQQSSFDAKAAVTALQESPEFLELLSRQTQAVKDRRFNKLEGQLGNLEEQLAKYEEYRKLGKSPEEARREMQIDQLIAEGRVPTEPQQLPGKQTVAPVDTKLDEFFQAFDVDPTGPEATQLIRDGKTDTVSLTRFVIEQEKRQSAPPNPASIMPAGSGDSVISDDIDEIHRQLVAAQKAVPKDWQKIRELNAKFHELSSQT